MLVWQQPHIIWMTELQRLHAETPAAAAAIVHSMADVVTATADFMASYAAPVPKGRPAGKKEGELWLGPPTDGTSLSGPIPTILTVLSWICAGVYMCRARPSPVCA